MTMKTTVARAIPTTLDPTMLANFLASIQAARGDLHYHEFQQIDALSSPRPNMPASDAIPFTRKTAEQLRDHLIRHQIPAVMSIYNDNSRIAHYSIIFGRAQRGVERGVEQARKMAAKRRAHISFV